MEMYDTLANGEQVKCFYDVAFYKDDLNNNTYGSISRIGGSLNYYGLGSILPIKTEYYVYPKDFCIFDYRIYNENDFDNNIHIVKNGVYVECVSLNNLKEHHILEYWIDNQGDQINIKSIKDVFDIINDFRDDLHTQMHKFVLLKPKEKNIFKWYTKDEFVKEKQFGEYLYAFKNCYDRRNDEGVFGKDCFQNNYLNCKNAFKEFLDNNPGITDKYMLWQNINKNPLNEMIINMVK